MLKYIIKRLLLSVLILLGVSFIVYVLVRCMPVDFVERQIASISTNNAVSQELIDNMYKSYGLDGSILDGYINWLTKLCSFDFGERFSNGLSVASEIKNHMGISFIVALIATVFEFMIAIPLGITAATHQYSIRDYVVTVFVMIGISLPSFFLGRVFQIIAPAIGFEPLFMEAGLSDASFGSSLGFYVKNLFLPILLVVVLSIGGRMRMTRTNMLEVMNSDYIRTARAKGLSEHKVIYKHAFRNTLIPLVTSLAGLLPTLFSGAIITEEIFNLPGIGQLALQATMGADIPFIMGYNMFLALLSILGVLFADIMYAIVDPRVKLS